MAQRLWINYDATRPHPESGVLLTVCDARTGSMRSPMYMWEDEDGNGYMPFDDDTQYGPLEGGDRTVTD